MQLDYYTCPIIIFNSEPGKNLHLKIEGYKWILGYKIVRKIYFILNIN